MSLTFLKEDAGSAVFHDTLLHRETLLVVSSRDLEDVTLVVVAHHTAIDFLAHSPVKEGAAVQRTRDGHAPHRKTNAISLSA